MADARLLAPAERALAPHHRRGALDLARNLPELCVSAREVAASVAHGLHGRRRAGSGEAFWQFRPFSPGETATRIDWRRSARDDRTYVREREWEAAQTVWLWIDRSPSMAFASTLARQSKLDRAITLGFAAADLLVRGGERVGLIDLTRPLAARNIVDRFAEALANADLLARDTAVELPRAVPIDGRARVLLIGDGLSDADAVAATLQALSANGARGHLLVVADPAEETFPFEGHVELRDSDSSARLRLGDAQALRATYLAKLAVHREQLFAACRRIGWTAAVHRTDRPASEALLRLAVLLADAGPAFAASG